VPAAVVPNGAAAPRSAGATNAPTNGTANGHSRQEVLLQSLLEAVRVAMVVERHAADSGWSLRFSSEDVRAIGLSLFIGQRG
jgi:ribosomal protein S12 methylthiotransferase accessory factor YcaO